MREEQGLRETSKGDTEMSALSPTIQAGEEMVKEGETSVLAKKSLLVRVHLQGTEKKKP